MVARPARPCRAERWTSRGKGARSASDENPGAPHELRGCSALTSRVRFGLVHAPVPHWSQALVLVFAWFPLGSLRAAHAQEAVLWRLQFDAPPECPGEAAFRRALSERARRSPAPGHRIIVTVTHAEAAWVGRLMVDSPIDGVRVERTTTAPRCEDLGPALALMTALALDLEPAPAPSTPRASRPAAAPKAPLAPPPRPVVERNLTEAELGFLVSARSLGGFSLAPSITMGSHASGSFAPWIRISGEHLATEVKDAAGHTAELGWTLGQLDVCSHKLRFAGDAFVSPCLRLSVGAINAQGQVVANPHNVSHTWGSLGPSVEVGAPLFGPLWVRLQGGFDAPFASYRVMVDSTVALTTLPAVVARGGIGLGVRLW